MTKIPRKTQKIFSGLNPSQLGIFGSAQSGTPLTSSDLDVLQSTAYEQGWTDATIGGDKRPPLEEFNSIKFVNDTQTAYVFQEGIAEYDIDTEYFIGGLVKEDSTGIIYRSLIDNNQGNDLINGANWLLLGDLLSASNIKIVNSLADLPTPSGGEIALDPIQYLFNDFVDIGTNSLIPPVSGSVFLNFVTLNTGIINNTLPLFKGSDFASLIIDKGVFVAVGGKHFDLDNEGDVIVLNSIFASGDIGDTGCNNFTMKFCSVSDYGSGISSSDRTDLIARTQLAIIETGFTDSQNTATNIFNITGNNIISVFIEASSAEIQSNETLFRFDESLKTNNTQIVVRGFTVLSQDGLVFEASSLRQNYINAVYSGNIGLQDSTAVAKILFNNNSADTTINIINQNEPINTDDPYNIINLQRFIIQDLCTFDNLTDTINTTFNHGLVNNSRIFFHTYTGTLPTGLDNVTEYYIINITATSFQVSLTQGGVAIDFTDNGTGTLYYRHKNGVSDIGHVIYIGLEDINLRIDGWVTIINTFNSNDDVRAVIMKIAVDGSITEDQTASKININNTRPQSSQLSNISGTLDNPIITGEGVVLNIRNSSSTNNLRSEEVLLTLNKV